MMEGFDFEKVMKNVNGDPTKVWGEVDKLMKGMKMPKSGIIEIPIILTKYTSEAEDNSFQDEELRRLSGMGSSEEVTVEEIKSVAKINLSKYETYYKGFVNDTERAFLVMDSGQTYETDLTYIELEELLGVG